MKKKFLIIVIIMQSNNLFSQFNSFYWNHVIETVENCLNIRENIFHENILIVVPKECKKDIGELTKFSCIKTFKIIYEDEIENERKFLCSFDIPTLFLLLIIKEEFPEYFYLKLKKKYPNFELYDKDKVNFSSNISTCSGRYYPKYILINGSIDSFVLGDLSYGTFSNGDLEDE